MKKLKVVTVVGTRPEIIRLSRLIPTLDEYTEHVLVHTGQNSDRQLNEVFFEDLELRQPDYYLNVDTGSMGALMGDVLRKTEEVFTKEKPDAVMILGDTNSAVAAIVSERMHIPVYHMEAGNRSFDANVPEELNRRMVDHVSTFNLPYNDYSLRNLIAEGLHPKFIFKTGSPMLEVIEHFRSKIEGSNVLETLNLNSKGYILASLHRQENVDSINRLRKSIKSLVDAHLHFNLPVVLSTHPRTMKAIASADLGHVEGLIFHPPFGYLDYNKLQLESLVVISDSGSVSEESAILNFPAVTLRDAIERPEGLVAGRLLSCAPGQNPVPQIEMSIARSLVSCPEGYSQTRFSETVTSILFSTQAIAANGRRAEAQP